MSRTSFASVAEVAAYIQEAGIYKASRKTVYNHVNAGYLKADGESRFPLAAVRKYAEAHLPLRIKKTDGGSGDLSSELIAAKAFREQKVGERAEFLLQKDRKKFVHVADHTLALAGRWQKLREGLESLAPAAAGDLVDLVTGNPEQIGAAMAYLQREFRAFLAQFAAAREFEVKMTEDDINEFLMQFRGAPAEDDVPAD